MWLVVSEDAESARTMADGLDDGNSIGSEPGPRGTFAFTRAGSGGLAIALGGPLREPTLEGRGHPSDRTLVWSPLRRRSMNNLAALAKGCRHLLLTWPQSDAGWLMALQAIRDVGEVAPRAARLARMVHPDAPDEHDAIPIELALAAEASIAVDMFYAAVLADVAPSAGRHTAVALTLLASSDALTAERTTALMRAARLPDSVLDDLAADGLVWGESASAAPATKLVAEAIGRAAPGLADPAGVQRLDGEIQRIREGSGTVERTVDLARRMLRDAAPTGCVPAPKGLFEGLVLGVCPYCPNELRPIRTATGRLLACSAGEDRGCGLRYPLPTVAAVRPGRSTCDACGAPTIRVRTRGWESQPRCAAALDCPDAVPQAAW